MRLLPSVLLCAANINALAPSRLVSGGHSSASCGRGRLVGGYDLTSASCGRGRLVGGYDLTCRKTSALFAAPLGGNRDEEEPAEGEPGYKRAMAKRLWNRLGRRKEGEGVGEEEVLDESENADMYAALRAQREKVEAKVDDTEIYEALTNKGDFPMVAKKLNEALANRSLTTGMLPPVLVGQDFSDFAPSSGQTPGEVISGVLKALKEGGVDKETGEIDNNAGVATLLRFMSPASSFGDDSVDDDDFIKFVLDSEYDILLSWSEIVFVGNMRLSYDGTKAYQTVKLQSGLSGDWSKVKWALSLREGEDCAEVCDATSVDGFWLIDSVMVTAK